ncbi:hypothetical protein EDC96DRAFT_491109 [Choanephora cucurbitarum]|nr:hypothetical protein EDC96DRAFT_491109 [Choanephora cucurbitarum]
MQNNSMPPIMPQFSQPQPRLFHPQVAYPIMANIQPSERTQGVFSTYASRLKQSDNNALLLPESYVTKKSRFDSEDEFDEFMESDEEEREESDLNEDQKKKQDRSEQKTKEMIAVPPPSAEWQRVIRKKNEFPYSAKELEAISDIEEVLVPVRLDIDVDSIKLRDRFLWNMNEQYLTPEKFAEMLCVDLQLSIHRFAQPIADSIRSQVLDFESFNQVKLPSEHTRVVIHLDLQVGKVNYRDQFEWEIKDENTNAPEVFSRQLAAELGIGGEYVSMISHAIREQLFKHKKQYAEELMIEGEIRGNLENAFRPIEEAKDWVPRMDMLSNDELEKLLIAQERNIRRMRRETRFKRSSRRN